MRDKKKILLFSGIAFVVICLTIFVIIAENENSLDNNVTAIADTVLHTSEPTGTGTNTATAFAIPISTPEKVQNPVESPKVVKANYVGNTSANILNGGLAAEQDGWVYYKEPADDNKLYAKKVDETGKRKLCDDVPSYINVVGEYIYYINNTDDNKIYKINIDGTKREKIYDKPVIGEYLDLPPIYAVGKYIYFASYVFDNPGLRRIDSNGENETIILKAEEMENPPKYRIYEIIQFTTDGTWIYYTAGKGTYRMKMDGSGKTKISDMNPWYLMVCNGWLYYSDLSSLYKTKSDGTKETLLFESECNLVGAVGDWVYFSAGDIYKVKADSTKPVSLGLIKGRDNTYDSIDMDAVTSYGGKLHFYTTTQFTYGVRLDGSGRKLLSQQKYNKLQAANEKVYFTLLNEPGLYYSTADNLQKKYKITDTDIYSYKVFGNSIYYIPINNASTIYRMNLDGTGSVKIRDKVADIVDVENNRMYYFTNDSPNQNEVKLFKSNLDGTNEELITALPKEVREPNLNATVLGDSFYLFSPWHSDPLVRIKKSGEVSYINIEHNGLPQFKSYNGELYFDIFDGYGSMDIKKCTSDGTNIEMTLDKDTSNKIQNYSNDFNGLSYKSEFEIINGVIYFMNEPDDFRLYKYDLKTKAKKRLSPDKHVTEFVVSGNNIIYNSASYRWYELGSDNLLNCLTK